MKAASYDQPGDPPVLHLTERRDAALSNGQRRYQSRSEEIRSVSDGGNR